MSACGESTQGTVHGTFGIPTGPTSSARVRPVSGRLTFLTTHSHYTTTANVDGKFTISLPPGGYQIVGHDTVGATTVTCASAVWVTAGTTSSVAVHCPAQ